MTISAPAILIVDDDEDTCRNLSDILTDVGYHVDAASDGVSALALVRQHGYGVTLLDLIMPVMNEVMLYRAIHQVQPEAVAILVTGQPASELAQATLAAGVSRVVPKPIDLPQLLDLVNAALPRPRCN
jgi:two-component system response regulator HydG